MESPVHTPTLTPTRTRSRKKRRSKNPSRPLSNRVCVSILNNPTTTQTFVLLVLAGFFDKSIAEATDIIHCAEKHQIARVGVYPAQEAKERIEKANHFICAAKDALKITSITV